MKPEIDHLDQWMNTASGRYLWQRERESINSHLKYLPGPSLLLSGARLAGELADMAEFPFVFGLGPNMDGDTFEVLRTCDGLPEAMPFETDGMASLAMLHTLEFSAHPHQVLREAKRVLRPEGYLMITGFNPVSPVYWGVGGWALRKSAYPKSIWHRRMLDWLRILEFEIVASNMFCYAPCSVAPRVPRLSQRLEQAGDRWWPLLGAGYVLVARNTVLARKLVGLSLSSILGGQKPSMVPVSNSGKVQNAVQSPRMQ